MKAGPSRGKALRSDHSRQSIGHRAQTRLYSIQRCSNRQQPVIHRQRRADEGVPLLWPPGSRQWGRTKFGPGGGSVRWRIEGKLPWTLWQDPDPPLDIAPWAFIDHPSTSRPQFSLRPLLFPSTSDFYVTGSNLTTGYEPPPFSGSYTIPIITRPSLPALRRRRVDRKASKKAPTPRIPKNLTTAYRSRETLTSIPRAGLRCSWPVCENALNRTVQK